MSSSAASSSAHAVRMSAGARQFLQSHIEAEQQDVMLPALQLSVKMSGHLITIRAWEGTLVFAAKNSAGNEYTLSAQLVLDQMLRREAIIGLIKAMEDANICLSFECITAFNGDHGYPKRSAVDVMICTAIHTVTELGPSDPWTNVSVFSFCRSHGLPCAQCLYALDEAAAVSAFDAYRGMCHQFAPHTTQLESMFDTFTAQHLCVALESFSHKHVSDVVEGFVVHSTMLSRQEIQTLLTVQKEGPMPMDLGRLLSHDLRRAVNGACGDLMNYEHALNIWKRTCEEGRGFPTVRLERVGKWMNLGEYFGKNLPSSGNPQTSGMGILKGILDPSNTVSSGVTVAKDTQTQFVQSVLKTCIELGIKCKASFYSAMWEGKELHLVILHVVYDAHHFKFHRHADSAAERIGIPLALYRGFAIRLMKNNNSINVDAEVENGIMISAEVFANFYPKFDNATQQDSTRLISDLWEKRKSGTIRKFKFSYYMYATMLCRSLLEAGGVGSHPKSMSVQQWELKCKTTVAKWGMKPNDQVPYLLRLLSWHAYVQTIPNKDLRSSTYLTHFCRFLAEEALWHEKVKRQKKRISSVISRAVYVISPEHHIRYHEKGTKKQTTLLNDDVKPFTTVYANSLAETLGVECVDLTEQSTTIKNSTNRKPPKRKNNQNQYHQQENNSGYIDCHFTSKVVVVGNVIKNKSGGCSSKTVNNEESSSIPILPRNAKVTDETVAVVDFGGISALPEGIVKSKLNQWVTMFQECQSETWGMRQHPPGSIAESLLEMERQVVQPILIFPCGIPGSGKSVFGWFLCKYGVKLVCSDDTSVPKRNKRAYDALIESKLKPFTLRRHSQRGTSDGLTITGKGEGVVVQQQQLPDIQHQQQHLQKFKHDDGTDQQRTLSAVYRDKNASSDQFPDIIKSVSYPTRVVAIVFGGTQESGGLEGQKMKSTKSPPMTNWEIAVCMRRILLRQNHEGGLDATLNIALRVVLGFAKRYTGSFSTKGIFMDHLKLLCGDDNVLSIPICKNCQFHRSVPREIEELLKEGWKFKNILKLGDHWERKLRSALERHDAEIKSIEIETSSDIFGNAINDAISTLLDISNESNVSSSMGVSELQDDEIVPDSVTSLFVEATMQQPIATSLSDALRDIKVSVNENLKMNGVKSSSSLKYGDDAKKKSSHGGSSLLPSYQHLYQVTLNEKEFVTSILSTVPELSDWLQEQSLSFPTREDNNKKYHVTLAFIKRYQTKSSQQLLTWGRGDSVKGLEKDRGASAELSAALDQLVGSSVKASKTLRVSVNSCACDGKAAALIVCGMDPSNIRSSNRVAHITLTTAKDVPPRHSTEMLESGNYNELKLGHSISFSGFVTASD